MLLFNLSDIVVSSKNYLSDHLISEIFVPNQQTYILKTPFPIRIIYVDVCVNISSTDKLPRFHEVCYG